MCVFLEHVRVCVYVCECIRMNVCRSGCPSIKLCVRVCVSGKCVFVCESIFVCVYEYVFVCMNVCICAFLYLFECMCL